MWCAVIHYPPSSTYCSLEHLKIVQEVKMAVCLDHSMILFIQFPVEDHKDWQLYYILYRKEWEGHSFGSVLRGHHLYLQVHINWENNHQVTKGSSFEKVLRIFLRMPSMSSLSQGKRLCSQDGHGEVLQGCLIRKVSLVWKLSSFWSKYRRSKTLHSQNKSIPAVYEYKVHIALCVCVYVHFKA